MAGSLERRQIKVSGEGIMTTEKRGLCCWVNKEGSGMERSGTTRNHISYSSLPDNEATQVRKFVD